MVEPPAPERDPYAAPAARVEDPPAAPGAEPAFFPVSLAKLSVMSFVTLQLYLVYWFYKNWKCVQRYATDRPNAPMRALFFPLMSYSLFARINERAADLGVDARVAAGALAIGLFVISASSRLPDPWSVICFLQFAFVLPVQAAVNRINAQVAPAADANARYGGWNIAGIVLGGLFMLLVLVGLFVPEAKSV